MVDFSGLRVKLLHPDAKLPTKEYSSAGYDLYSVLNYTVPPHMRSVIDIGIATEMPHGYFGKIMDRSGLAANHGLTVLGGVIDNDYRGEWKVILQNTSRFPCEIIKGERVAQVVFMPCGHFQVNEVDELQGSKRGEAGFGSTGR